MMAADSRITGGGPYAQTEKIYRVGNSILGMCGDAMMARYFIEWFKSPRRSPNVLHKALGDYERSEILVMELNPGGIFLWDGWGVPLRIKERAYAIGSGSPAALAFLKRSRSKSAPIDAVRAAMTVDEWTGGEIVSEWLIKKGK